MRNYINIFIAICSLLLHIGCNTTEPKPVEKKQIWEQVAEFSGCDIKCMKIIDGEFYVCGQTADLKPMVKKTKDGVTWINIVNQQLLNDTMKQYRYQGDDTYARVNAIAKFRNKIVIASGDEKFTVYEITDTNIITPLVYASRLLYDVRDMIEFNGELHVGMFSGLLYMRELIVVRNDASYYTIPNNLIGKSDLTWYQNQSPSGVIGMCVFNFIEKTYNNKKTLFASYFNSSGSSVVTISKEKGFDFISSKGLTKFEWFNGATDIIFKDDTLYAATITSLKYLKGDIWETFGKELILEHNGSSYYPNINKVEIVGDEIYVGTVMQGVFKWNKNAWLCISEGLPQQTELTKYHIDLLKNYNKYLFCSFGETAPQLYGTKGIYKLKIN